MTKPLTTRRDTLRALAAFGSAAPFAMTLAQVGEAAAATAQSDYKALVCVFLHGGNDSNNLLLATDSASWGRYWQARNRGSDPIALMPPGTPPVPIGQTSTVAQRQVTAITDPAYWGGVLPIVPRTPKLTPGAPLGDPPRTFALHPLTPKLRDLFHSGRMAGLANVGTLLAPLTKAQYLQESNAPVPIPQRLFSHQDQQAAWQSGHVDGAATGWGGKLADVFRSASNPASQNFASLTTSSPPLFSAGQSVTAYRVNPGAGAVTIGVLQKTGSYNNSSLMLRALSETLKTNDAAGNALGDAYVAAVQHSLDTAAQFNASLAKTTVPPPPAFTNPLTGVSESNPLADQLRAVAQTIAGHNNLRINRQVFFVQLGGFDTHDNQNKQHTLLYSQIDHAFSYFDSAIRALKMENAVTTFTASDFNRSFTTNGDGTDHAWGGHHLIMGGAVNGGDIYGTYPTLGIDNKDTGFTNPDAVDNALIPTTSVEQYLATLGRWFGVSDADLLSIFPRLSAFPNRDLGFMRT